MVTARYTKNKTAKGYTRISLWIPTSEKDEINSYIEFKRDRWECETGTGFNSNKKKELMNAIEELYHDGSDLESIARQLNDRGFTGMYGGILYARQIKRLWRSETGIEIDSDRKNELINIVKKLHKDGCDFESIASQLRKLGFKGHNLHRKQIQRYLDMKQSLDKSPPIM